MSNISAISTLSDPATAVVDRDSLTRAFDIISNAVDKKSRIDVLGNARLLGDGATMFITATDLDTEITVAVPAAADSRFGLTLPANDLKDILRKATPSDFVAFTMPKIESETKNERYWNGHEYTEKQVTIESFEGLAIVDFERVKYRLNAIHPRDFPEMNGPDSTKASCFPIAGKAFYDALDSTMGAISTEETRYYLNGIYMHVDDSGQMAMVATDGHRLYIQYLPCPDAANGMPGVIIPRKTVTILHRLMKGKACPETVSIEVDCLKMRVMWDDITVTSKLIDGTFPSYQRIIPSSPDKTATFEPEIMLESVRNVTLLSKGKCNIALTLSPGSCEVSANNHEKGSATADFPCSFDGDAGFSIGFNATQLVDALATASPDGSAVTWRGKNPSDPVIFTGSRDGWKAIVMPTRI